MKQRLRDLEARDNWIEARIDELMDAFAWCIDANMNHACASHKDRLEFAKKQATREHAEIEAMTLNAQIDNLELK